MDTAFEITSDDVQNACSRFFDKDISWQTADDILDVIDTNQASRDALQGNTIDEQTGYALDSLREAISNSSEALSILERA